MKNVKALFEHLNSPLPFEKKYPHLDPSDKVHVLYVAPCMNATGYYRMIAPALELNKTKTHKAIISQIHKWDFNKKHEEYDSPIDERLVHWADYVVFPAFFTPIRETIDDLTAIKSDIQLVMDIDCNYFDFPVHHPGVRKLTQSGLRNLIENISQMDIVTAPTTALLEVVDQKLEEYFADADPLLAHVPNLLSNEAYLETAHINKNKGDTVRIGLIANPSLSEDIKSILLTLKRAAKRKDTELFVFGWNGKLKGEEVLKEVPFKFVKPVSITDYPAKLNNLALDILLVPSLDVPFNTKGKTPVKYLEASAYAVPVICSDIPPYNEVIINKENGFLAGNEKDWDTALDKLIKSKELREEIGREALKYAWKNWGYNKANLRFFKELFI